MVTRFTLGVSLSRIAIYAVLFSIVEVVYRYAATGIASIGSAASSLVAGVLLATILAFIFSNLPFKMLPRVGLAWLSLFIIQMFSNLLEGAFFTTVISTITMFFGGVIIGLLVTLVQAVLAGILFPPTKTDKSLKTELSEYFSKRPFSSWLWRIALCSLIYFPIYFTFGGIVSPFVVPYYTNPSLGLYLTIPSFEIMIPLEFLRGFLYVVALLPIIATLKLPKRTLFFSIVALLYVAGAFVPFLTDSTLPVFLRVVHGLEILADYVVFGGVIVYILKKSER